MSGYWSYTTHSTNFELAWVIYFDNNVPSAEEKSDSNYVRCVRGSIF
ncbi:MAG: hypothetical protein ACWA5P_00380 [bacterium]